ncbi:DUF11 domain-containing protein [Streptomyces sp. A7024]|uniref:DUF11 domain-containing protein n=1 Tax=Streptomyces coryli TaxID=1128680 RepID=A0A6G4TYD3_9ACTN|nr:DUF11 domain-containing protein [Streptomyces coryli]NGN64128.1 DUF11 domain-containing protein [Streptomyces coryli]
MALPSRLRRAAQGALIATAAAAAGLTGMAPPAAAEVTKPFEKVYDDAVYGDFITGGNTVLGCDGSPDQADCERATESDTTNNNTLYMAQLDRAGLSTATFNSSSGQYEIPPGSKIVHAQLMWGGNDGTYGSNNRVLCDIGSGNTAKHPSAPGPQGAAPILRVDGGPEEKVSIDDFTQDSGNGPHYYSARSDVTSLFQNAPDGTPFRVDVGDVWAPEGQGCVGGWSLTLVYAFDEANADYAPQRRAVDLYYGHVKQGSRDTPTTVEICDFYKSGSEPPRASTSILEGDRGVKGDQFRVNGTAVRNARGEIDNFFDSTVDHALDPDYDNALGMDAKEFELPEGAIKPGDTCADLTFSTRGDTYVPFQVALSVPVPDLKYTKSAEPTTVRPGDTVTYTVEVQNVSDVDYPNAQFSDDLSDNLDQAEYNDDADASTGTATYEEPRVRWKGDLKAHETATITYSVTVNDPPTGDDKLRNNVIVEAPGPGEPGKDITEVVNCAENSEDPACGTEPKPAPPEADVAGGKEVRTDGPVAPGGAFRYLVTATNNGPDPAEDVTATDTLPDGLIFQSGADCTAEGQKVTCGPVDELAKDEKKSWTLIVRLDPDYTGDGSDLGNKVTVKAKTPEDPKPGNNTSKPVTVPVAPPDKDKDDAKALPRPQGERAQLAATGTSSPLAPAGLSAGALVVGAGALAAGRRLGRD